MHNDGLLQERRDDLSDGPCPVLVGLQQSRHILLGDVDFFFCEQARLLGHIQDVLLVFAGQLVVGQEIFLGDGLVPDVQARLYVFGPPLHLQVSKWSVSSKGVLSCLLSWCSVLWTDVYK